MASPFAYVPARLPRPSHLQQASPPPSPSYSTTSLSSSSSAPLAVMTPRLRIVPLPPITPPFGEALPSPPPSPRQQPPLLIHSMLASGSSIPWDFAHQPRPSAELSEPATHPPVSYLRIVTPDHYWTLEAHGRPTLSVFDVLYAIWEHLQVPLSEYEMRLASDRRREMIAQGFRRRTSRRGVDDDLRRVDYLGGATVLTGLKKDDREAARILSVPDHMAASDSRMALTLVLALRQHP